MARHSQQVKSAYDDAASNRRVDRLRRLLNHPDILAADPSPSGVLALAPTITLQDSSSRLDWNVGVAATITAPWRAVSLYESKWTWIPAGVLFCAGLVLYRLSHTEFSFTQLGGLPEILPDHSQQHLVTTGIRARVRHPVYLAHLCEMLAWSFGTGLAVCWALTAFAIMTGAVMIQMEDGELEKRFGEEYRHYQSRVPAVLPKIRM